MVLATVGFATASVVLLPTPSASADAGKCSISYACLWGNRSYSGDPWWEEKRLDKYNTGYWNNDETSSIWNRTSTASLLLYDKTNQDSSGGVVCVGRGYASRDLNEESPEFDDRISSMWLRSGYCSREYDSIDSIGYPKKNP